MSSQLRSLAETDVRHPIPPEILLPVLQQPPFVHVPGTFNTRDLGLLLLSLPTSTSASAATAATAPTPSRKIRPGFLYRSGALDHLTPDGQAILRDRLGVRRIFDLRSQAEHAAHPDPVIAGIETVWLGDGDSGTGTGTGTTEASAAVADMAPFAAGEGERGYVGMYYNVLDEYKGVFAEVLRSVRDRPEEPILFHCTAGRDRTGVLAGLLESLAGYDPEVVQTDYLLSRIGYEPARELLLKFALVQAAGGVDYAGGGDEEPDLEQSFRDPAFYNLVSLKAACWDAFVGAVERHFGGFGGYVTKVLGFSDEDLDRIRKNLVESG